MKRILLIDDNPFELTMLCRGLKEYEVEVHWLPRLIYARQIISEQPKYFDLILIDCFGTTLSMQQLVNGLKDIKVETWAVSDAYKVKGLPSKQKFVKKEDLINELKQWLP